MLFKEILGLSHIKNHLSSSADAGRIPHAQLFVGPEGCGLLPMALAYAQYIICQNSNGENNGGICGRYCAESGNLAISYCSLAFKNSPISLYNCPK